MSTKTTFAGLFLQDANRHVTGTRAHARHCWAVCDPRPGRAERAAMRGQGRKVWRSSSGRPAAATAEVALS